MKPSILNSLIPMILNALRSPFTNQPCKGSAAKSGLNLTLVFHLSSPQGMERTVLAEEPRDLPADRGTNKKDAGSVTISFIHEEDPDQGEDPGAQGGANP